MTPEPTPATSGQPSTFNRRALLARAAGGAAAAALALTPAGAEEKAPAAPDGPYVPKGNLKQSVCRWCFSGLSVEDLAKHSKEIGLKSVELLEPKDFPIIKKYDLTCAMVLSHSIHPGLNNKKNHDACLKLMRERIVAAAEAGYPNVICFSGNREGMPDDMGIENCVLALKQVVGLAEEKKVTICMELLNSKVDHKDYMCDRTPWGVEVVKRVGSERFKLLYDIYHMQIMEGDVIRTIRDNHKYIGHYHTGGVPGRAEIDDTQELNYTTVMKAIRETGYQGHIGQEFIPKRDPVTSLAQAYRICDV